MMMEMTVPAGAMLEVTLETPVASDTSKVEDPVRGRVAKAVAVDGMTTIPAGSVVTGTVIEANPSGRVKGRASIAIRFNRVVVANTPYTIQTARITHEADATKGEDAKKIGVGAGAGAIIGAIAGGKKGAAIGTAVGAGAGTGVVVATKGKEVGIGSGTTVKDDDLGPCEDQRADVARWFVVAAGVIAGVGDYRIRAASSRPAAPQMASRGSSFVDPFSLIPLPLEVRCPPVFLSSSTVEHPAVNRRVAGSNPA